MPLADARVLVVGAGPAGLAAAWRLGRAGVRAYLFEKRERGGGRLRRERLDGLDFEPWPAVVPGAAPQLAALLDEIEPEPAVPVRALESVALPGRGGPLRRPLRTRAAVRPRFLRSARLARVQSIAGWLGSEPDPAHPAGRTRLDDRSLREFCDLYLGRAAGDELFGPLFAVLFGLRAEETTRQLALAWMDSSADLRPRLWQGPGAALDELPGRLAAAPGRIEVRTGCEVRALLPGGRGVLLDDGRSIEADAVVVATGPREAARLVPDLGHVEREFFEGCETRPGLRLAVSAGRSARPPARLGWLPAGGAGDLAGLIDATPEGAGPDPERRLLLLAVRPERVERLADLGDERLAETLCAEAEPLAPGLASAVREARAFRESGLPAFPVGRFRRVALAEREARRRPERRVFFCGGYRVGPHVEAALASGRRATGEALAALGIESA